jgi:hypothetical protein
VVAKPTTSSSSSVRRGQLYTNKSSAEGKTFHMQSPVYLLIREK